MRVEGTVSRGPHIREEDVQALAGQAPPQEVLRHRAGEGDELGGDEPGGGVVGVGVGLIGQDQVWRHVRRLRDEHGTAVFLTTH
jgi:hypothetical protein